MSSTVPNLFGPADPVNPTGFEHDAEEHEPDVGPEGPFGDDTEGTEPDGGPADDGPDGITTSSA